MRVLVTGADGFIGSHLCEALAASGYDVRAMVLYNSWESVGRLSEARFSDDNKVEIIKGDIRDFRFVKQSIRGVDAIFHLASLIAIPFSYEAPSTYLDTNIGGTMNILEACRDYGSDIPIVQMSTSEIYGSAQFVPMTELHPKSPQSPYAASKVGADALVMSYYASYSMNVRIARPFNTYGPRQTPRAVIPTIITQSLSSSGVVRLGAVTPTRDFTFVTDTCRGLIKILECDRAVGKEINIGSGTEISVADIVKVVGLCLDKELEIVVDEQRLRPKDSEVDRLFASNSLIRTLTGWQPAVSFEDGVRETIAWRKKMTELAPDEYAI